MIHIFRKELKKWNIIWWFVLASLGLGGASMLFIKQPSKDNIYVASVNDRKISLKDFHQVYAELKSSLDDMAMYWGIQVNNLAKLMGLENLEKSSLDKCVQNSLLDQSADQIGVEIDPASFKNFLGDTISKYLVDPSTGKVNVQAYQNYLSRMNMSISDYEESKEKDYRRNSVRNFLQNSYYMPNYFIEELFVQKATEKKFSILSLPLDHFLKEAKKASYSEEVLKKYFLDNREKYRVPEKRKAKFWVFTPEDYSDKVSVNDYAIEQFYERNKSSLYRILRKIKISLILVKSISGSSEDAISIIKNRAEEALKLVKENPADFSKIAKKYSDHESASKGGLIDFFQRGKLDSDIEKVAFVTLKEKGEVSNLIESKEGFAIVKLEDSIPASDKPLSSVRDDIIKTLKEKRSLSALRGDLEKASRSADSEISTFEEIAKSVKIKSQESKLLSKEDSGGYELEGALAGKLFVERGNKKYGYFVHQGKHILYFITEKHESFVPKFVDIKKKILSDFNEKEARENQKKMVDKYRSDILDGKITLDKVAEELRLKLVTTDFVKTSGDKDSDLKFVIDEAFAINDKSQLLVHSHGDDYYFARLVDFRKIEDLKEEEKSKVASEESKKIKNLYSGAVIESLKRIAKIEIHEGNLKAGAAY